MIKVTMTEFYAGMKFELRNAWRKVIAEAEEVKEERYPFLFQITDIVNCGYVCESVPDRKSEKIYKLFVNDDILRYLFGTEVSDCNVGLYTNDYLPFENSRLILTDSKDPLDILPVRIVLNAEKNGYENGDESITSLSFVYKSLILDKTYTLKAHNKDSWKLLTGSDLYMTDVEKMFQDTFIHKGYVLEIGNKFADYLEVNGQEKDAEALRINVRVHDNSKILNKDEFRALTRIINDKQSLKSADKCLSMYRQDAIELHWAHNEHHPEHYQDICEMGRQSRQEMAVDFCARSYQYGTDLIDFVEKRQEDRFHFPEQMYDEIINYCKILVELMDMQKA